VCAHCGNPENPDTPVLTYELNGESYLLHENCHAEWLAGPDPDDWTFNSDDAPEVGR
jgi:hypothetical protein